MEPDTKTILDYATPVEDTGYRTGCLTVLMIFLALLTAVATIWIIVWAIAASGIFAPYIGHF